MDRMIVVYYIDSKGVPMYINTIDYMLAAVRFTHSIDKAMLFDFQQATAACQWLQDTGYSNAPQGRISERAWIKAASTSFHRGNRI